MIEGISSKSGGWFLVGEFHTLMIDYGKVKSIIEISKYNTQIFRVIFEKQIVDVYDFGLVIQKIIELD